MPPEYWVWIRQWANEAGSDGCTGVKDYYVECCWEHDYAYATGEDPRAAFIGRRMPITRAEADRRFRECIQARSRFGRFSPMSWWRWAGVRLLGRGRFAD